MKVAIYARVSKDEQNIENQLEPLLNYAKLYNYDVVSIYKDVMTGGASNRPEFQRMLKDARLRRFETILVWSLDRFSREGISNTLNYIKRLRQYGVNLKSYKETWVDTTQEGMGDLLLAIFSWVAEQERRRISERTKEGLRNAKNVGKRGKDKRPRAKAGYYKRWEK